MSLKDAIVSALRDQLLEELATMSRIARVAAEAATHEENKPENSKDMRSTEASYVARGQAERARDLEHSATELGAVDLHDFSGGKPVGVSALVTLSSPQGTRTVFVLSVAGGRRVRVDGLEIQVVTPTSPMGQALMEMAEGDAIEVPTPQGLRIFELKNVC